MTYDPTTYQLPCPKIPLEHPPCNGCDHWNPQQTYEHTSTGKRPDGVKLCHRDVMHHDFSCFKEREGANMGKVLDEIEAEAENVANIEACKAAEDIILYCRNRGDRGINFYLSRIILLPASKPPSINPRSLNEPQHAP